MRIVKFFVKILFALGFILLINTISYMAVPITDNNNITTKYSTNVVVTIDIEDDNDRDGLRPEILIAKAYRLNNGKKEYINEFKTINVSKANKNQCEFLNLYAFDDKDNTYLYNTEIICNDKNYDKEYILIRKNTEDKNINSYVLKHNIKTKKIDITNKWSDSNDKYGLRPKSYAFKLYANGKETNKLITVDDNKTYAFRNLPVYENKEKVDYSIQCFNTSKYYTATYKANKSKTKISIKHSLKKDISKQIKVEGVTNKFIVGAIDTQYTLKYLEKYIPQSICVTKNYVLAGLYNSDKTKKSIILVYDKKTQKYIKKFYIPYIDHIGTMTYINGNVAVGLNNIDYQKNYLGIFNEKSIDSIKLNETIKFSQMVHLDGIANFSDYDGEYFWSGQCLNQDENAFYGFKVNKDKNGKLVFTKKYKGTVFSNIQGLAVTVNKNNNRRTFIFSQSYGETNTSNLYRFNNIKLSSNMNFNLLSFEKTILPTMSEEIEITNNGNLYVLFESAASKYKKNMNTIIDKICLVRLKDLFV